jgi:hypothetical protein
MRIRSRYIAKYGPDAGAKLYHALQSQAAHAGVSARLRRKLDALTHGRPWPPTRERAEILPLFPEPAEAEGEPVGTEAAEEAVEVTA